MTDILLLATEDGLRAYARNGAGWGAAAHGLHGHVVTSVVAREGVILAGTEDGIYRSDDLGQSWAEASAGLSERHVRWLAYHPHISDSEFAGTEPAALFVSRDGGGTWRECPEVAELRRKHEWWMPYGSGTGCVRGFAFYGQRAYAAVEVGGLLRSDDGGETWALAPGSSGKASFAPPPPGHIFADVHSVHVHPTSADLAFAPTAGGIYRTEDGGATWKNLYECYVRAVWVDPADAAHLILGPGESADTDGRIEETRDGGQTWTAASGGLSVPWPDAVVERFTPAGEELLAVVSDGRLLAAPLATLAWRQILPEAGFVNCAALMG